MEYLFYGQITPSFKRVSFNIKNPPLRLTIDSRIGKFNYTLLLNNTSDVVVNIESDLEISDLSTLLDMVRYFTQSFYDTALLNTGVLCNVTFTSLILPDKTLAQINIQDISAWLQPNIFDFETETLFELKNNPVARIAIADIKYACLEPDLTALFAYRAIEGIMNFFDMGDTKKNWVALRENLNLSRDFFTHVEKLSVLNRHGKPFDQTFIDRQVCIYIAMIVLQRYLHYINEGKTKLSIDKYPEINTIQEFGIQNV
ncbi:MAG: hypothetical protein ABI358_02600 [Ginsengibacter sp.]